MYFYLIFTARSRPKIWKGLKSKAKCWVIARSNVTFVLIKYLGLALLLPTASPGCAARGSGLKVWGSGFRVQGSGSGVPGSGFWVQGSGFRVQGAGGRGQEAEDSRGQGLVRKFDYLLSLIFLTPKWNPQGWVRTPPRCRRFPRPCCNTWTPQSRRPIPRLPVLG
jgi:hypothetical protein